MVKASDKTGEGASKTSADSSPVADALKDMPAPPLHPLFSHPTAAFAAATAIGFGFATQMAGAFLGSLQGAMDVGSKLAKAAEKQRAEAAAAAVEEAPAPAEPAAPVAVKPTAPQAAPAVKPVADARPAKVKTPAKAKTPGQKAPAEKAPAAKPAAVEKAAKTVAAKPRRAKADDLKKISGIGPKLEQVLNGMGVQRYADIAGWSEADIARIDGELEFGGRIGRDDWVGQARALSGGKG